MDFRVKCLLQTIFGALPNGEGLNFLAQKHISKGLPPSRKHYEELYQAALQHHSAFEKYGSKDSSKYVPFATTRDPLAQRLQKRHTQNCPVILEIGCGWHLAMALAFSSLGYGEVIALDVTDHARAELIDKIIEYMKEDGLLPNKDNITYLAPCDSASTGLEAGSVDYIYSHAVFEHILPAALPPILKECKRVLKDGGVMSLAIDYADHYRTFDRSITPYNFLKYSEKSWRKYNPKLHYVNRLRHRDFMEMFAQAGFCVVEEHAYKPDNADEIVKTFPFHSEFTARYTIDELTIANSHVVLTADSALSSR